MVQINKSNKTRAQYYAYKDGRPTVRDPDAPAGIARYYIRVPPVLISFLSPTRLAAPLVMHAQRGRPDVLNGTHRVRRTYLTLSVVAGYAHYYVCAYATSRRGIGTPPPPCRWGSVRPSTRTCGLCESVDGAHATAGASPTFGIDRDAT